MQIRLGQLQRFAIEAMLVVSSTKFASAQFLRVGVTGGVPLTGPFTATTNPNAPVLRYNGPPFQSASERNVPYIVGPTVEIHLISRLALEIDALYRRGVYNFTETYLWSPSTGSVLQQTKHGVNIWQFPVLLKYRGSIREWHPFVGVGVSEQYAIDNTVGALFGQASPVGPPFYTERQNGLTEESTSTGTVFSAGLEFDRHRVRISPQVRFVRWFSDAIQAGGLILPGRVLQSQQNEVNLLVGITF